jgi:hypothetical protein
MATYDQESKKRSGNGGLWFFTTITFIFSMAALAGTGLTLFQISQLRQEISGLKQEVSSLSTVSQQSAQNPAETAPATPEQTAAPAATTPAPGVVPNGRIFSAKGTAGSGVQFTVTLTELRRSGSTLVASFSFISEKENIYDMSLGYEMAKDSKSPADENTISGTYLIDPANQKKYEVMRDGNNNPICTRVSGRISSGQTVTMSAQFSAPPPSTKTMNVYFPQAGSFIDVPIQ